MPCRAFSQLRLLMAVIAFLEDRVLVSRDTAQTASIRPICWEGSAAACRLAPHIG